jgi:hypothetical protein
MKEKNKKFIFVHEKNEIKEIIKMRTTYISGYFPFLSIMAF